MWNALYFLKCFRIIEFLLFNPNKHLLKTEKASIFKSFNLKAFKAFFLVFYLKASISTSIKSRKSKINFSHFIQDHATKWWMI